MTAESGRPLIRVRARVDIQDGPRFEDVAVYINVAQVLLAFMGEEAGGEQTLTVHLPGFRVEVAGQAALELDRELLRRATEVPRPPRPPLPARSR